MPVTLATCFSPEFSLINLEIPLSRLLCHKTVETVKYSWLLNVSTFSGALYLRGMHKSNKFLHLMQQ